jgi:hypothetical protein
VFKSVRVTVAALAFVGFGLAPVVANATIAGPCIPWWCHPCPPKVAPGANLSLGIAWALTFFLCAGMSVGQQDVWAKNHHTTVSGRDRLHGMFACAIPGLGFYNLTHHTT